MRIFDFCSNFKYNYKETDPTPCLACFFSIEAHAPAWMFLEGLRPSLDVFETD